MSKNAVVKQPHNINRVPLRSQFLIQDQFPNRAKWRSIDSEVVVVVDNVHMDQDGKGKSSEMLVDFVDDKEFVQTIPRAVFLEKFVPVAG